MLTYALYVQALFCLGDLAWGHAQLQEHLAGQLAAAPGRSPQQPIPYLQVSEAGVVSVPLLLVLGVCLLGS